MTKKKALLIFIALVLFPLTILAILVTAIESLFIKFGPKPKPEEYLK